MNKLWVIFSYDWVNVYRFGMITDQYRRSTSGIVYKLQTIPSEELKRFHNPNFKIEFFYE